MKIRFPWGRQANRSLMSIGDPQLLQVFGLGPSYAGVDVTESSSLGLSAVYRACALISGTLASLPLRTYAIDDETRLPVRSLLDNPGGPDGPTPFEWTETVLLHLLLHGNSFLLHIRGGAGQLAALLPAHPLAVSVEQRATWPADRNRRVVGGKYYRVTMVDGSITEHDASTLTHIVGMSTDGIRGMSVISVARHALGTGIAGDRSAARMFSGGALISGLVSVDGDDTSESDAQVIREQLDRGINGWENAGSLRFINRRLKFTPWTMTAADSQFLESRAFQVEDVARWFGVPPHLLMQTDKQTSWGAGVAEQNRGLQRTVLAPWAARIEQRLSRLLRGDRLAEYDFSSLVRPTPEQEVQLALSKYAGGLITRNEARLALSLPPVDVGDTFASATPAQEATP